MSHLEDKFEKAWAEYGRGRIPRKQYRFTTTRRFRLDFAWVSVKVGVEIDGFGSHGKFGAHQTIAGVTNNHEKQNLAIELGWVILRYTSKQLGSKAKRQQACEQVLRVIEQRGTL